METNDSAQRRYSAVLLVRLYAFKVVLQKALIELIEKPLISRDLESSHMAFRISLKFFPDVIRIFGYQHD